MLSQHGFYNLLLS